MITETPVIENNTEPVSSQGCRTKFWGNRPCGVIPQLASPDSRAFFEETEEPSLNEVHLDWDRPS